MTRRQEDQRREDLAELQQLQASSQITGKSHDLSDNNTDKDDGTGAKSEEKNMMEEQRNQKQQSLHRLESLCAAAELSLNGLLDRFIASQDSDSELWKTLRAQKQQQQQRKSVVVPHRRASLLLPHRVSAIDLAHARSAAAQHQSRRGSIEILIDMPQQHQSHHDQLQKQQHTSAVFDTSEGPSSSIQEEEGVVNSDPAFTTHDTVPKNTTLSACTSTATTTTLPKTKKIDFFSELPDAVVELGHHFDLLLSLETPSSLPKNDDSIENSVSPPLHTPESNTHSSSRSSSMPSGYKRSTMVGPAWMETKSTSPIKTQPVGSVEEGEDVKQSEQENTTEAAGESLPVGGGGVSPRTARQQAKHEAQAAERYMRRLVGATVEPPPEIEDPFALDSSDEDQPPFDRYDSKMKNGKKILIHRL